MADSMGLNPAEFEWETSHQEAGDQIQFEKPGEVFTGEYLGSEQIAFTDKKGEAQEFTQLHFSVGDNRYDINAGYELREAFKNVTPGTIVRITYVKDVKITGQESPMKSFRVDTAKARAGNQKRG